MNQKAKLAYPCVIVLSLAFGLASLVAIAKNDNAQAQSQGKSKTVNLKNFEKADKAKGTTNAKMHEEKVKNVIGNLEQAAIREKSVGNTQVSNQLQQVVQEQAQVQEQTAEAMREVESRGKIKTFLIGTDYKNLGQLRSSLVHNRNEIRKLTQALTQTQTEENKALIEAQLATLMQERERIKTVITTNESGFSLFGWVSRFLLNYEQTPINEQEESALAEEVEDAIETTAAETADTTVPATPVTTTETTATQ